VTERMKESYRDCEKGRESYRYCEKDRESYRDYERECYKDKERATEKENRWNEKSFRRFQSFTPIQISKVVLPRLTQC